MDFRIGHAVADVNQTKSDLDSSMIAATLASGGYPSCYLAYVSMLANVNAC